MKDHPFKNFKRQIHCV